MGEKVENNIRLENICLVGDWKVESTTYRVSKLMLITEKRNPSFKRQSSRIKWKASNLKSQNLISRIYWAKIFTASTWKDSINSISYNITFKYAKKLRTEIKRTKIVVWIIWVKDKNKNRIRNAYATQRINC